MVLRSLTSLAKQFGVPLRMLNAAVRDGRLDVVQTSLKRVRTTEELVAELLTPRPMPARAGQPRERVLRAATQAEVAAAAETQTQGAPESVR
jgi:hypothetical protein